MLWRTFRRKPLRKFLTLVQLLLGSLATTLALSPFLTPVDTSRENLFYLNAGFEDEENGSIAYSIFSEYTLEPLQALAPAVQNLAVYTPGLSDAELVAVGKRFAFDPQASVTVSPSYLEIAPPEITRGSALAQADFGEAVVLLSDSSARLIFGDVEPVGQTLLKVQSSNFYSQDLPRMDPVPYRVVGTFADTANALNTTPSIIYPSWAPESFDGGVFPQILVQATPGQREAAKAQMLAAVRQHYRDEPMIQETEVGRDFFISDVADFANDQAPFNPNLVILALFGVVSLCIGSIGLFSTTLLEVLERTFEIGLKRALGASRAAICREFVVEAASLSFVGAALGTGAAALLTYFLAEPLGDAFFYGLRFSWAWGAAAIVVFVGVVLGALVGFFPALKATRMVPIESLRDPSKST